MKAVLCTSLGPASGLRLSDIESPVPGPGELVVDVKAASLNFLDTLIIEGKYQLKPELPFSPGAELAGVVSSLGKGVSGFRAGDRVMAFTGHGACREQVAVRADQTVHIPASLAFETAAGLMITYGTSLHALADRAVLQPGETLAVLGAAGGVGQAAVEIGKLMGARVIACASSPEKLEFCRALGADVVIDYSSADLKDALRQATGGNGADVIYDPVGGAYAEAALRSTAWNGRFLVIGFASGEIPRIPLNLALLKGCSIVGVFWGEHTKREPEKHRANMSRLLDWAAAGRIGPHIHKTYRLADTAEALGAISRREVKGKAIVVP